MNRRHFLKALGITTVATTIPITQASDEQLDVSDKVWKLHMDGPYYLVGLGRHKQSPYLLTSRTFSSKEEAIQRYAKWKEDIKDIRIGSDTYYFTVEAEWGCDKSGMQCDNKGIIKVYQHYDEVKLLNTQEITLKYVDLVELYS